MKSTLPAYMNAARRQFVVDALAAAGGNVQRACRETGVCRQHMHKLMKQYGLKSSLQRFVTRVPSEPSVLPDTINHENRSRPCPRLSIDPRLPMGS